MARGFVTNLGDLFVGHDKRKYPYMIVRESKNIINGKRSYEYMGKSCTRIDAEAKMKAVEEDPCCTVKIIELGA